MKKKFVSIFLSLIITISFALPAFASMERVESKYNQKSIDLSLTEIQEKKDTVQVPEKIDEKVSTFVQCEKDMWSVLSKNLDESDYGGKYVKDGVLHIKVVNQENVEKTIKKILEFIPQNAKNIEQSVIIETDAIYSVEQLEKMMDDLPIEECKRLHIYGIGIKSNINGLTVDSDEWTEEKKREVSEILGIDINHIEFGISTGLCDDNTLSSLEKETRDRPDDYNASPGALIHNKEANRNFTLGVGVYYEIEGITDGGEGDYGWVTAGHYCEEDDNFYKQNVNYPYMGFVDFVNLEPVNGRDYATADAAIIYKDKKSEVDFSLGTFNNKVVLNTGEAEDDEEVYMIGGYSGLVKGKVLNSNYRIYDWSGQGPEQYRNMIKTNISSVNGDSGGPLLRERNQNSYTILGILKGREKDNQALFTSWDSIENDLVFGKKERPVQVWLWP